MFLPADLVTRNQIHTLGEANPISRTLYGLFHFLSILLFSPFYRIQERLGRFECGNVMGRNRNRRIL